MRIDDFLYIFRGSAKKTRKGRTDASGQIKADCVWLSYKSVNNCLRRSFSFLFDSVDKRLALILFALSMFSFVRVILRPLIQGTLPFCQVNYVDFGNSEVVPVSAIRQEMPFMEIPQQCLQLVLRGIEPVSLQIPSQPPPLVLCVIF